MVKPYYYNMNVTFNDHIPQQRPEDSVALHGQMTTASCRPSSVTGSQFREAPGYPEGQTQKVLAEETWPGTGGRSCHSMLLTILETQTEQIAWVRLEPRTFCLDGKLTSSVEILAIITLFVQCLRQKLHICILSAPTFFLA